MISLLQCSGLIKIPSDHVAQKCVPILKLINKGEICKFFNLKKFLMFQIELEVVYQLNPDLMETARTVLEPKVCVGACKKSLVPKGALFN